LLVYIFIAFGDPIKSRWLGIPFTSLTLPHVCIYPKSRHVFPLVCVMVFFLLVFSYLRWEVVVRFADIGGMNCLQSLFSFLFITMVSAS